MTLIQPAEPAAKDTPMASYDPMAPHYEAFVGDAEVMRYPVWLAGLIALAAEHGATGGRALDVGCGTGRSLEALLVAGFDASGCDASPRMMEIARDRVGDDVDLQVAALPAIPPGPPLQLVTAVNDIINYVAPRDLDAAIGAMAGRMAPGGVLLFDANTPLDVRGLLRPHVLPVGGRTVPDLGKPGVGQSMAPTAPICTPSLQIPHIRVAGPRASAATSSTTTRTGASAPRWPPPGWSCSPSRASATAENATRPPTTRSTSSGSTSHAFHDPEHRKEDA